MKLPSRFAIVALAFAGLSASAWADWNFIGKTNEFNMFADPVGLQRSGARGELKESAAANGHDVSSC